MSQSNPIIGIAGDPSNFPLQIVDRKGNLISWVDDQGLPGGNLVQSFSSGPIGSSPLSISANGAASQAALGGTGSIFTGGTGVTTFPYLYLNLHGAAAVTTFNTAGTPFAINTPGGFTGDTLAFFANSTRVLTVNSGGQITSNSSFVAGINSGLSFASRSVIRSNADGTIEFSNNAGTGFTLFQLGGSTNSFPGLLVNGNSLQAQLADSSGQTGFSAKTYSTETACANGASPAICGSASAGSVAIPVGTDSTLVINTTAVTAKSQIQLTMDRSVTIGGITCNTNYLTQAVVISRVVGTSITIQAPGTSSGNPVCVSYTVFN